MALTHRGLIMNDTPQKEGALKGLRGGWLCMRSIQHVAKMPFAWLPPTIAMFLLAAPLGAPRYSWFRNVLGNRYAPGEQIHHLTQDFRTDHGTVMGQLDGWTADAAAYLGLSAILLGLLFAGGWLQLLTGTGEGSVLRRFAFGGARFFWRFGRLLLMVLLILGGLRLVLYGDLWNEWVLQRLFDVPAHDLGRLETLDSEAIKVRLGWAQDGIFALLFALVLSWATYTRARIAMHDSISVLWTGACAAWTILRHPIATLRPLIGLLLVEALLVAAILGQGARFLDRRLMDGGGILEVAGLFALGLAALLVGEIMRGAKYVSAVETTRLLVRPVSSPDPWHTIGGPGGPQYPVDPDEDERYGVSL